MTWQTYSWQRWFLVCLFFSYQNVVMMILQYDSVWFCGQGFICWMKLLNHLCTNAGCNQTMMLFGFISNYISTQMPLLRRQNYIINSLLNINLILITHFFNVLGFIKLKWTIYVYKWEKERVKKDSGKLNNIKFKYCLPTDLWPGRLSFLLAPQDKFSTWMSQKWLFYSWNKFSLRVIKYNFK